MGLLLESADGFELAIASRSPFDTDSSIDVSMALPRFALYTFACLVHASIQVVDGIVQPSANVVACCYRPLQAVGLAPRHQLRVALPYAMRIAAIVMLIRL